MVRFLANSEQFSPSSFLYKAILSPVSLLIWTEDFFLPSISYLLPQPKPSTPSPYLARLPSTKTRPHQHLPPISFFLFSICHHRLLSVSKKSIVFVSLSAPKDELVLTMAVDPRQHHLRHLLFFTVCSTLLPCSRFRQEMASPATPFFPTVTFIDTSSS